LCRLYSEPTSFTIAGFHDERRVISDWLSPLNFKAKQMDIISKRAEGTGQWLLESTEFKVWLDGTSETLWCPGPRGLLSLDRRYLADG
jgi:hypothetical protein